MGVGPRSAVSRPDAGAMDAGAMDAAPDWLPGAAVEEIEAGGVATQPVRRRPTDDPGHDRRWARRESQGAQ